MHNLKELLLATVMALKPSFDAGYAIARSDPSELRALMNATEASGFAALNTPPGVNNGQFIPTFGAGPPVAGTTSQLGPYVDTTNAAAPNLWLFQDSTDTWVFCGSLNVQGGLPIAKFTLNATAGATTAAAGDLTGADFVCAGYSAVGAANLTTRTAAQMVADILAIMPIPRASLTGLSYMVLITNTSGGTTTLVAGAGVTLTGTMTMATNTTRLFNVKVTNAAAGAEAITFQSVSVGTIS